MTGKALCKGWKERGNVCALGDVLHGPVIPLLNPLALLPQATDFGLSRFFKEGQTMDDIVGSPFYVAPEVLQRKYGKVWMRGSRNIITARNQS